MTMQLFNDGPALIGMVHLLPLPGTARYAGSLDRIVERALTDAKALKAAGFDALMVENFGDAPFRKNRVEPHTIAVITHVAALIRQETGLPLGINVLRNDGLSALGIAGTVGAACIRVNILAGTMVTDQGIIEGEAPAIGEYRRRVAPDVAILADVHVKHARPLVDRPIEEVAIETVERAGADGLIVTGTRTGGEIDLDELRRIRASVATPVVAGSGVNAENISRVLAHCDGAIIGSSVKSGGIATSPVDPDRARQLVDIAR